jgi:cardiolipin synthase
MKLKLAMSWWKVLGITIATALLVILGLNFVTPEKRLLQNPAHLYGTNSAQFKRSLGSLLGPAILAGNRIQTLRNGDEIFPAMLADIRGAKRNIDFETYVYWSGQTGRDFAAAISERAAAGVTAHVLLDWVVAEPLLATIVRATPTGFPDERPPV